MEMREISLVENIQREDLTPVETALAIAELIESFNVTQEEIATSIGWSRTAVTNKLRLVQLPEEIKILLGNGELSEGHCRTLLAIESHDAMIALARDAVNNGFSVRQIEDLVKRSKKNQPEKPEKLPVFEVPASVSETAKNIGISIRITGRKSKMKLQLEGVREDLIRDVLQYIEENATKYFPGNT